MPIAHNLGFPPLGAGRELKRATESYWNGKVARDALLKTGDRKSTRLNSSHGSISYAVFCLKKKKKTKKNTRHEERRKKVELCKNERQVREKYQQRENNMRV